MIVLTVVFAEVIGERPTGPVLTPWAVVLIVQGQRKEEWRCRSARSRLTRLVH